MNHDPLLAYFIVVGGLIGFPLAIAGIMRWVGGPSIQSQLKRHIKQRDRNRRRSG